MIRSLRVTALACAIIALTGCASDYEVPSAAAKPTPTSTEHAWNVGMVASGFNASGKAVFTYADGTTRTMRLSGKESEARDTNVVLVGQKVSITVTVEESTGDDPSQISCGLYEADYNIEGFVPIVSNAGSKGDTFTCEWTNDGTLPTPKPEK